MHQDLKGVQITVKRATPLITTAEAKTFLRVDDASEDALIDLFVDAATTDIENFIKRTLITQTYKLTLDSFDNFAGRDEQDIFGPGTHEAPLSAILKSDFVYLPRLPIQSITSVTTFAIDNTSSVFADTNYTLDTQNGRIFLNEGAVWPTSLRDKNGVEIVYDAGYGDAATDVPAPIQRAAYNQLRKNYMERGECELTESTKCELAGYRIYDYLGFWQ